MEQHLPIMTKKVWSIVKLALFMLRKGISKKKILMDINLMLKRRKIASKSASKGGVGAPSHLELGGGPTNATKEVMFSSNNTPLYCHYLTNKTKSHDHKFPNNKYNYYMTSPNFRDTSDHLEAVNRVLETMLSDKDRGVRQLRITDSPFPLQNDEVHYDDQHVDEAADNFIKKFYSQLKEQIN